MANQKAGFQLNSTITGAFWLYRPDPVVNQVDREIMVQINNIQYLEATPAQVVANNISSVSVQSNVLTVTGNLSGITSGISVGFTKLTNAAFLNKQVVTVISVSGNSFTANFTNPNYGPMAEPPGAQGVNAGVRTVWIYYPETGVSTSQAPRKLEGVVATLFLFDMEALFF